MHIYQQESIEDFRKVNSDSARFFPHETKNPAIFS